MEIVAGQRVDVRCALPIGADARAKAIVEPAELRLDLVAWRAASRTCRIAVQVIELGAAGRQAHLIHEGDRIGHRQRQATAAAAAAGTAEEASSTAKPPTAEAASATTPATALIREAASAFSRWAGRRTGILPTCRALGSARAEGELSSHLIDY